MTSFGYVKHKQKALKFTWQHFEIKISFLIKVNLDPIGRWKGLDKINVQRVYYLRFFKDHRVSCLWFIKFYQKNKIEK
jgi:hypothetical protein